MLISYVTGYMRMTYLPYVLKTLMKHLHLILLVIFRKIPPMYTNQISHLLTLLGKNKKVTQTKELKKKIGMLELVDRFRLGRNGFITVQVQILLPIRGRNNMI